MLVPVRARNREHVVRKGFAAAYAIVRRSMETSLARRQRHRRNGNGTRAQSRHGGCSRHRHPPSPLRVLPSGRPRSASAWPSAATACTARASTTPRPCSTTSSSTSRRSSTTPPARWSWRASASRSGPSRPIQRPPADPRRRHDEHRGPHVLGERGLRPDGDPQGRPTTACTGRARGASTITQQLVRARLLPDEVLAGLVRTTGRSRRSSSRSGSPRSCHRERPASSRSCTTT